MQILKLQIRELLRYAQCPLNWGAKLRCMVILQQITFLLVSDGRGLHSSQGCCASRGNINIGKANDIKGNAGERWKNLWLVAFGQKKMFKKPIPALLHLFILRGFLVINLEVREFVIDGRRYAPHFRALSGVLLHPSADECVRVLAVAVLVACVSFDPEKYHQSAADFQSPEITGHPKWMPTWFWFPKLFWCFAIPTMNAADQGELQGLQPEHYTAQRALYFFSSYLTSTLQTSAHQHLFFRTLLLVVSHHRHFGFAIYAGTSSWPSQYAVGTEGYKQYAGGYERGENMFGLATTGDAPPATLGRFGAKDINDLSWNNLMASIHARNVAAVRQNAPPTKRAKIHRAKSRWCSR